MAPLSFAERVVRLEQQMQSLQELPKRIDDLTLQVSQLRVEMRGEFSEIRSAMAAEFTNVRDEMAAEFGNVRAEMAAEFGNVREEMAAEFGNVRAEMAAEFGNVRAEMAAEFGNVREEMAAEFGSVRAEMAAEFGNVRAEVVEGFAAPTGALARAVEGLHAEIRAGDEATRRQMRVLHEDLVGRIALIQEGLGGAKRKSAKPRRPR